MDQKKTAKTQNLTTNELSDDDLDLVVGGTNFRSKGYMSADINTPVPPLDPLDDGKLKWIKKS